MDEMLAVITLIGAAVVAWACIHGDTKWVVGFAIPLMIATVAIPVIIERLM